MPRVRCARPCPGGSSDLREAAPAPRWLNCCSATGRPNRASSSAFVHGRPRQPRGPTDHRSRTNLPKLSSASLALADCQTLAAPGGTLHRHGQAGGATTSLLQSGIESGVEPADLEADWLSTTSQPCGRQLARLEALQLEAHLLGARGPARRCAATSGAIAGASASWNSDADRRGAGELPEASTCGGWYRGSAQHRHCRARTYAVRADRPVHRGRTRWPSAALMRLSASTRRRRAPPQAILLAVPPRSDRRLDSRRDCWTILEETAELLRARGGAVPSDVDPVPGDRPPMWFDGGEPAAPAPRQRHTVLAVSR